MRNSRRASAFLASICVGLAALAAMGQVARADSPGSGSIAGAPDVLSPSDALAKALDDVAYRSWLGGKKLEIPWCRVLKTPSHKQANGHYCGPATVQIISGFWGHVITQTQAARYMGTTSSGTNFTVVDDALRHFTGKSYYCRGTCTSRQGVYNEVQWAIGHKGYPAAGDYHIVASVWNRYTHNHAGHIITTEAYDWTSSPRRIRLDDSFNEADYYGDGGQTFGHRWYPRTQIADGVLASTSPADRRFLIY